MGVLRDGHLEWVAWTLVGIVVAELAFYTAWSFFGPLVLVLFLHFVKSVFPNVIRRRSGSFVTE